MEGGRRRGIVTGNGAGVNGGPRAQRARPPMILSAHAGPFLRYDGNPRGRRGKHVRVGPRIQFVCKSFSLTSLRDRKSSNRWSTRVVNASSNRFSSTANRPVDAVVLLIASTVTVRSYSFVVDPPPSPGTCDSTSRAGAPEPRPPLDHGQDHPPASNGRSVSLSPAGPRSGGPEVRKRTRSPSRARRARGVEALVHLPPSLGARLARRTRRRRAGLVTDRRRA